MVSNGPDQIHSRTADKRVMRVLTSESKQAVALRYFLIGHVVSLGWGWGEPAEEGGSSLRLGTRRGSYEGSGEGKGEGGLLEKRRGTSASLYLGEGRAGR